MTTDCSDLFDGDPEDLRDEGLARVLHNAGPLFANRVRAIIQHYMRGQEVTGEDVRVRCLEAGVRPHHPNAWGATLRPLIGTLLVPTGERRSMRTSKSHARTTDVYRVV